MRVVADHRFFMYFQSFIKTRAWRPHQPADIAARWCSTTVEMRSKRFDNDCGSASPPMQHGGKLNAERIFFSSPDKMPKRRAWAGRSRARIAARLPESSESR